MDQTGQNTKYEPGEGNTDGAPNPNQQLNNSGPAANIPFNTGYQNTGYTNQPIPFPSSNANTPVPNNSMAGNPLRAAGRGILGASAVSSPRGPAGRAVATTQNAFSGGGGTQGGRITRSRVSQPTAPMTTAMAAHATATNTSTQAFTAPTAPFVRPKHTELNHSRIDEPGPDTHHDLSYRNPGPHQWPEFLHTPGLLRYAPNAAIKDIQKHCRDMISAATKKKTNKSKGQGCGGDDDSSSPLVEGGPYDVSDANCVWKYCEAYLKRRAQLNNNQAASRSRAMKAAALKHWRALALEAGFPEDEFRCDLADPGNEPDAAPALLSAATRNAIAAWRLRRGQGTFAPLASAGPGGSPAPGGAGMGNMNMVPQVNTSMAPQGNTNMAPQGNMNMAPQNSPPVLPLNPFARGQMSQLQGPAQYQQQLYGAGRSAMPPRSSPLAPPAGFTGPIPALTYPGQNYGQSMSAVQTPLPPRTRAQTRNNARRAIKTSSSPATTPAQIAPGPFDPPSVPGPANFQAYYNNMTLAQQYNAMASVPSNMPAQQYNSTASEPLSMPAQQYNAMASDPSNMPAQQYDNTAPGLLSMPAQQHVNTASNPSNMPGQQFNAMASGPSSMQNLQAPSSAPAFNMQNAGLDSTLDWSAPWTVQPDGASFSQDEFFENFLKENAGDQNDGTATDQGDTKDGFA